MRSYAYLLLALCIAIAFSPRAAAESRLVGNTVTSFTLPDYRGKDQSLDSLAGEKGTILYFMGTECPLARLYAPRMQSLADKFSGEGVHVIGVSPNVQDSLTELAAFAQRHEVRFPILKDLGNRIADAIGATRTPEVFLLDAKHSIVYHGRVDDQYSFGAGVGLAAPSAKRSDLALATEELLAGKSISVPETPIKGCLIGRVRKAKPDAEVTYTKQISRLIQKHCISCHREGQIGPFAMNSYDEVYGWGEMIAEVVQQKRMPPWHADPKHGEFSNDSSLNANERELFQRWAADGCPEGDPSDLPDSLVFRDKWFLSNPDQIIYIKDEPVDVKAEGVDPYRYYTVDPKFTEDKWVSAVECRPGNSSVVHHIIAFIRPPGQPTRGLDRDVRGFNHLSGFAPGTRPLALPQGWAKRIPAGSRLVFQMHYTPNGSPQKDRSSIALKFLDESEVTHEVATTSAVQHRFLIPPGAEAHKVEATRVFEREGVLLSLFPHMHMRGAAFKYEMVYPNGDKETLLDVPAYDFNWQNSYILKSPKRVPAGSRLHCTAIFNNSESNLANPDPTKSVRWGDQTWEEMMIGWYDLGIPVDVAKKIRERNSESESDSPTDR